MKIAEEEDFLANEYTQLMMANSKFFRSGWCAARRAAVLVTHPKQEF
jgi:hypothetical protein